MSTEGDCSLVLVSSKLMAPNPPRLPTLSLPVLVPFLGSNDSPPRSPRRSAMASFEVGAGAELLEGAGEGSSSKSIRLNPAPEILTFEALAMSPSFKRSAF
ncbi:hypothetical protein OGATHE_003107 [Ogataea polymorpha]|uniref:Uncharacterized protein n=1 Tax=Ogataea polymorpha TaxID=460523 RepID=A0A9P8P9V9_9ASCO|nr:hypothetical protein OGATHE_003107 [Ogataea polymorpha]